MALDLTATLRRVPRWAWFVSAGVGLGGIAYYIVANRAGVEDDTTAEAGDSSPTGSPDTFSPSPVPGIVVPDINFPETGDVSQGTAEMHALYIGAVQDILDSFGSAQAPAAPAPVVVQPQSIITGGGVACTPRNGTSVVQCTATQKAAAAKPKDTCVGKYPHKDQSGAHKGRCFYTTVERRNVKQGGHWFCLRQHRAHYKGGGTEWKGVVSKKRGKC